MRLNRYLGTSPGFWCRLQLDYELMRADARMESASAARCGHMRREIPGMLKCKTAIDKGDFALRLLLWVQLGFRLGEWLLSAKA